MADAWALEPRLPEEVNSKDSEEVCPLCGSPNFSDGYCSICGYSTELDEAGPIQLEDEEDLIEADTTDGESDEIIDEDEDGDLDPSEEDLVENDLVDEDDSELVYDEDGIMVFEENGQFLWYVDGTDETGIADTLEEAIEAASDDGGMVVEATRHFTHAEIQELEDEIEGTPLANASRLRF